MSTVEQNNIKIYIQGAGLAKVTVIEVPAMGTVHDIACAAHDKAPHGENAETIAIFIEDGECALSHDSVLIEIGIGDGHICHRHHCHEVCVAVSYNSRTAEGSFSPATRIARVLEWAEKELGVTDAATTEYALQVSGTTDRPTPSSHLGSLVHGDQCSVELSLVVVRAVQG